MEKRHSINLIIKKEEDTPLLKKIKKILFITSLITLVIFIILFSFSLYFLDLNLSQFNSLKTESNQLEKSLETQKSLESVYLYSMLLTDNLKKISQEQKDFQLIIKKLSSFSESGISVNSASVNKNDEVNFSVVASSSSSLDEFITKMLTFDEEKIFSNIQIFGLNRDKKGRYNFTLSLKYQPKNERS